MENISVFQLLGKSHGAEQREESFVGLFMLGVGTVLLTGTNKIMRWVRTPPWLWWRAILFKTVPFPAKPQGTVEWQACVFPVPTHLCSGGEKQFQSAARPWTEGTAGILVLTRCMALNCWLTVMTCSSYPFTWTTSNLDPPSFLMKITEHRYIK